MAEHADIANTIASLAEVGARSNRGRKPIAPAKPAGPSIGASQGVGFGNENTESGGIAWPLTETAYEKRELYPEETLFTSDGIFSWTRSRVKSLEMQDASGTIGKIQLKQPAV